MLCKDFIKGFFLNKNTLLILFGLLTAISLSAFAFSPACKKALGAYREEATLLKLIQSSGAELKSVNVSGWVRVDEKGANAGDPEVLANYVAAQLNLLEPGRKVENWQNQFARGAKIEGQLPGGLLVSILGQTMELPEEKKVSHVMVSLDLKESKKARFYRQKIYQALNGCGGLSHVAITYSGKIENELNGEELLAEAEKMMTLAGASVQEKTVKDNLVSLTGFGSRFSSDMSYAGIEINLNVALRSNPMEHVTYVYAASPVIFTEY